MESSPSSPSPYGEYNGGDNNKDKDKKDKDKKSPLRVPLPASEIHASEPKRNERIIPLFEKLEIKDLPPKEESKAESKEHEAAEPEPAKIEIPAEGPHQELAELHDDLWDEFDQTEAIDKAPEPDSLPELSLDNVAAGEQPVAPIHEAQQEKESRPEDALWHETHTVHINTPPEAHPEDVIAPAPSAAGMAAEVAATEPDELWEEFDAAPPARTVPEWHPESTTGQFEDIMQHADMGEDFVQATSSASGPARPNPNAAVPYGTYENGESPLDYDSTEPQGPTPPLPPNNNVPHQTGGERPQWYPANDPRRRGFGPASLVGVAAEAAVLTGAMAGGAAHGVEAGLVAGAAAGGVVGGIAGHEAGKHAAQAENRELRQTVKEQNEHIATITNEQRVTHEQVEHLTQANHQLAAEQQKAAAEQAAAVSTAVAAERVVAASPDEKVVRSEWVDMVVDKRTGKLIEREGVNEFGDELRAEQRAEAAPPDPVATALAAARAAAQLTSDVSNYEPNYGEEPLIGSGQIGQSHELAAGQGQADSNHRLPAPQSSAAKAFSSPLLWMGVVILLLAFFAAAFLF
ncbi:MAG TPA: hypothetical protein VLH86_01815 [Patescibacteria group bacterium]|nr:hypothetical protein [Patescibacteria group bacterium]